VGKDESNNWMSVQLTRSEHTEIPADKELLVTAATKQIATVTS